MFLCFADLIEGGVRPYSSKIEGATPGIRKVRAEGGDKAEIGPVEGEGCWVATRKSQLGESAIQHKHEYREHVRALGT